MISQGQPRRFAFDERPITGLDAFDWHKVRHRPGNFLEVWTRKDGRRARHHVQEDGTLREMSATTIKRRLKNHGTISRPDGTTFNVHICSRCETVSATGFGTFTKDAVGIWRWVCDYRFTLSFDE